MSSDDPPSEKWQEAARAFASWAGEQLQTDGGQPGLAYLHEGGLSEETIGAWSLGWCPTWRKRNPQRWGLDPRGGPVWLPRGVVIPCEGAGALWYVKVRRFDGKQQPAQDNKYPQPRGGKDALFGVDHLRADGRPLLLCEGERDTLLAWQELRDLVDVATLGGAGKRNLGPWLLRLLPYKRILAAYDADEAGRNGGEHLAALSGRIVSVRVPHGDDLTGFHQQGGDLRAWLGYHLDRLNRGMAGPKTARKLADARETAAWLEAHGVARLDTGQPVSDWLREVETELTAGT